MNTFFIALAILAARPSPKRITLDPAVAKNPDAVAKLQSHLYQSGPVELAKQATSMLAEKGFVVPEHEDPLVMSTDWQPDKKGRGRTRYTVRVVAMSAGASRIEIQREHDGGSGEPEVGDDLDAEWALLNRLEPDAAKAIQAGAGND